jgi:hypothetical protein
MSRRDIFMMPPATKREHGTVTGPLQIAARRVVANSSRAQRTEIPQQSHLEIDSAAKHDIIMSTPGRDVALGAR